MKTPDTLSHAQGLHLHSDLTAVFSYSQIVLVINNGSLTQRAFYFSCHVYPVTLQKRTYSALQKFIECNKIKNKLNEEIRLKENDANQMDNLEEMDQFLEKYNLPKPGRNRKS